jgi:hypothetical protein
MGEFKHHEPSGYQRHRGRACGCTRPKGSGRVRRDTVLKVKGVVGGYPVRQHDDGRTGWHLV